MFTALVSIKSVWHYKLTRVYSVKDLPEPVNTLRYNYTIDQVGIIYKYFVLVMKQLYWYSSVFIKMWENPNEFKGSVREKYRRNR